MSNTVLCSDKFSLSMIDGSVTKNIVISCVGDENKFTFEIAKMLIEYLRDKKNIVYMYDTKGNVKTMCQDKDLRIVHVNTEITNLTEFLDRTEMAMNERLQRYRKNNELDSYGRLNVITGIKTSLSPSEYEVFKRRVIELSKSSGLTNEYFLINVFPDDIEFGWTGFNQVVFTCNEESQNVKVVVAK